MDNIFLNSIEPHVSVDDYTEQKECKYKGERYAVRDNGAIYRYQRDGQKKRKNDCIWTFGTAEHDGYSLFCGERVHRIVAIAFHGEPPTSEHVVDHYDTNRQNNRPENLRWLTKLENILNNPYTRKKIEALCGSVESFLENPDQLKSYVALTKEFSWMRVVTKEESRNMLERMDSWLALPYKEHNGGIKEWIYTRPLKSIPRPKPHTTTPAFDGNARGGETEEKDTHESVLTWDSIREDLTKPYSEESKDVSTMEPVEKHDYRDSLTENALQDYANFHTPSYFPLCPKTGSSLVEYKNNITKGSVYDENEYGKVIVIDSALVDNEDGNFILVACKMPDNPIKGYCLNKIYIHDGKFAHEAIRTYFHKDGLDKYFTIGQGKEWTGGDVFDDYC